MSDCWRGHWSGSHHPQPESSSNSELIQFIINAKRKLTTTNGVWNDGSTDDDGLWSVLLTPISQLNHTYKLKTTARICTHQTPQSEDFQEGPKNVSLWFPAEHVWSSQGGSARGDCPVVNRFASASFSWTYKTLVAVNIGCPLVCRKHMICLWERGERPAPINERMVCVRACVCAVSVFFPRVSEPGELRQEYEDQVTRVSSVSSSSVGFDELYENISAECPFISCYLFLYLVVMF